MPSFRVAKLYKFKRSELIQWMDAQGLNRKLDTDEYVNRFANECFKRLGSNDLLGF